MHRALELHIRNGSKEVLYDVNADFLPSVICQLPLYSALMCQCLNEICHAQFGTFKTGVIRENTSKATTGISRSRDSYSKHTVYLIKK